ncbi:MAG: YdcF family protein [Mogibacterium sp.]|nr:YdcF family protein [Mogibacterium sp.]
MSKHNHPRRRRLNIVVCILIIVLTYLAITTTSIVSFSNKDETRQADVAIVLGASVYDNSPSPVFCERINHAVELYEDGYVNMIIMTGGVGEGNIRSEADIAREYAEQQGIPEEAILIEETSTITAENLENAKRIMEQNDMDTALIVSDPLHMKRAMLYAQDLDIDAYSSPTPTSLYRSWRTRLPFLMREEFYYIGYRMIRLFKR